MKILTCGCCGERAPGRQHWNQDTGYGLCPRCVPFILLNPRAGPEELKGYGTPGVNFAVPITRACRPGMLVAWKTLEDDGEYHGYHVGKLIAWEGDVAHVRDKTGLHSYRCIDPAQS